jgi:hypothetical protein
MEAEDFFETSGSWYRRTQHKILEDSNLHFSLITLQINAVSTDVLTVSLHIPDVNANAGGNYLAEEGQEHERTEVLFHFMILFCRAL